MPIRKYGKQKNDDALFDFGALLVSSSPLNAKEEEVDCLVKQLRNISITDDTSKRKPLKPIDANLSPSQPSKLSKASATLQRKPPTLLEQLLHLSSDPSHQTEPQSFTQWSNSLGEYFSIVKIAEASYGEVYRLVLNSSHPEFRSTDESVLKVLALKPPSNTSKKTKAQQDKESLMSSIDNVIAEVKLLQRMVDIPGFTNFRDIRVLKGRPSKAFAQAWKTFNAGRSKNDKSVFPDPSKKTSYKEDQLWAVIEMQDAGQDLEHIQLKSVWTIWDVFWGVTLAIAKGEQEAEFEHRDLHMGNICIKPRKADGKISPEQARIKGFDTKLDFSGLETTIIDYTLSRAETATLVDGRPSDASSRIEFMDLTLDNSLFEADATDEYQYEIYRYMRSAMYFSNPLIDYDSQKHKVAQTGRTWAGFHPQTNLIWLHFVLHELLKNVAWPSRNMKITLEHVDSKNKMEEKSARQKAKELEAILKELRKTLKIQNIPSTKLASARDLVVMALEKGWLDEEDVVGHADSSFASLV